jgi:hypothetical protein
MLRAMSDRWLSYRQMGEMFGLSAEAVRQRVRRLGWRTQLANDGRKLVLVPEETAVRPRIRPAGQTPVEMGEQTPVQTLVQGAAASGELKTLRTLVDVLKAQLAKAETEAAHARQQLEAERGRSDRAEQRADALRVELERARITQDEVRAAIAELAADVARAMAQPPAIRGQPPSLWRWLSGLRSGRP